MIMAVILHKEVFIVFLLYSGLSFFNRLFLIAYVKGEGIRVSETQFSDIFKIYCAMAKSLALKKVPPLFILQQGGFLNAFAIRFSRKNYIAIYSDIFSLYSSDIEAVKFVLAHELCHVKRKHAQKIFWTLPSLIVPFLTTAYSRACEYTCDNAGASFISDGEDKLRGLLLLAGGRNLYRNIDVNSYLEMAKQSRSLSVEFVSLFMAHPYLPRRIENIRDNGA
jgi:Zn-dependent protease with chaperone function